MSRATVWCGVTGTEVVGPYFFEEGGRAVTVTSARYVEMLNDFLYPDLQRRGVDMTNMWFQQDDATSHTATQSMNVLRRMFPERIISRFGDLCWPSRSPDLSVCDFFLWGYLKSRVYISKPRTIDQLKSSIREEIQRLPTTMLHKSMQSFQERLRMCVQKRGSHLTDIIFRN